ncbi:M48 family metallopeptidase [Clostridium estertheticum]|uniref:M48 family metallopeptidase n=1 Tax=Clostridium estertheticum TaxID=238834 RepID=UPI001C6E3F75|nr:M48 family metallopeptidase [Clostridium estertheticum]MBW9154078.1 M48 family metallopeptidase [Clostridium estertheticum]WLC83455.1 M48 family metallopeptidase [Clostridium estertheticum]
MDINYKAMDKIELKSCRHKAEKRWYRRMVVLNLLIIVGIIVYVISTAKANGAYFQRLQKEFIAANQEIMQKVETDAPAKKTEVAMDTLSATLEKFPDSIMYLGFIIFMIIALPFIVSYIYAQYRSMSVKITEKNFPEIYAIVDEYAARLGLKKVPKVYLIQGNGILNAFAAFIPFRQYIELYADLIEVAYREHHDMETLRFLIGHEMAHIRLGHATLHYALAMLFSNMIPILSSTASRTREYSCDRIGQKLSGSDGIEAMMVLTAGIHLYKQVDIEDYIENAKMVKGVFVWSYNLVADHPITSKRVLALAMKDGSGKLY